MKYVEFEVKTCSFDSVIVRFDINKIQVESLSLGDACLQSPVYETIRKGDKNKTYRIDVASDVLLKKGTIYLAMECVALYGEGEICFPVNTGSCYGRGTPMAPLEKMPVVAVHPPLSLGVWILK